LHYQTHHAQGKLVRVSLGEVFDVVVDIRSKSATFGKWFGLNLSQENKKQLWIPQGLAHGFLVLSETAEFLYKTTDYYFPQFERSLLWNDPAIGIEWPLQMLNGRKPLLAEKDQAGLTLAQSDFCI
jgi:dTDP-4-dehydrorhamnose 3,5-epimerase